MHDQFDKLSFYFPQDKRIQLEAHVKKFNSTISERVRWLLTKDLETSEQSNEAR